ncbi:MAG: beta-phosphoglucomutase [Anaerolineae bacterium]
MSETAAGFIFDLDGVLTDTSELHYLAWKRLADEEGIPFSRADNEALRGVSRRESLNRLLRGQPIDEATAQAWMARKNGYYVDLLDTLSPQNVLPGVHEFLDAARKAGIRLGVGSASKNARLVLGRLDLLARFDVIGDGYCVVHPKPHSDLFVWVAGGLGLPVARCVVFEDAEAGVEAALAAGMTCVGIGPHERVGAAHLVCDGLAAITPEQVIGLLARSASG